MNDGGPGRRRSVDVGGLALALSADGLGHGWGGWEETENGGTKYAEVLIDVRAHTETILNLEPQDVPPRKAIDEAARIRLVQSLESWHFEPHRLPDEEVIACAYLIFEALYRIEGMHEAVEVPLSRLGSFLHHLRQVYRQSNTYHNFRHALDVLQATNFFLLSAGIVPPVSILLHADTCMWKPDKPCENRSLLSCLTNEDLFALHLAAIGHDVGHPGLNNAFMKNAKTPLSVVYDDKSVLEQMHYSLMLQIMRHNEMGSLLDRPSSGPSFRKLLLGTVLATDMSVHTEFMSNFNALLDGKIVDEFRRRVLVCQALIKCADISNPCRPVTVSKHWAAALESEWLSQARLEEHLQLPASVKPSDNSLSEARGQAWFINAFVRPLFELTARGIYQMEQFAQQCRENLAMWEARCAELSESAHHDSEPKTSSLWVPTLAQPPEDFLSAFPPTLPESFRPREDPLGFASYAISSYSTQSQDSQSNYSGSSGSSHYESCESFPSSPTSFDFPASCSTSASHPRLEITTSHYRTPSVSSSTTPSTWSSRTNATDATASIRAAYRASVRKKKSWHRSSWNPSPSAMTSMASQQPRRSPVSPENTNEDSPVALSTPSSASTLTPSPLTPKSAASASQPVPLGTICPSVS